MKTTPAAAVPAAVALYMAVVQFLFVTTWTVYVIFLPRLLEMAGLPASLVPMLLLADQLVFMAMDIYVGVAADRAQRTVGRVGPLIMLLTALSCVAFLLLPFAARGGMAPLLLGLLLVWAVTSSALRAPPWVLLGKYAAAPSVPRMNTLMLWGLAAGGALAPYLGVALKESDPRLPFILSSMSLLAATAGIVYVERRHKLSPSLTAPPAQAAQPAERSGTQVAYLLAFALLALGFQIHYSINSTPQYLKLAPRDALQWLMPVFWIGFAIVMVPGSALCKRWGTLTVMALSALLGAVAVWLAASVPSLTLLIAVQALAGGAWGSMLMCAFTAAIAAGRVGREGFTLGLMFAVLALATLSRIGAVMSGLPKQPDYAAMLAWAPALCWLAGGLVLGTMALRAAPTRV